MKKNLHNTIYHLSKKLGEGKKLNCFLQENISLLIMAFKEEVAVSKAVSLFSLIEKLGVFDISSIETRSPTTIRKIFL